MRSVTEVWFMSEQLLSLHQLQEHVRQSVETKTFSKLSVHLKNILNEPIICPEEIKEIAIHLIAGLHSAEFRFPMWHDVHIFCTHLNWAHFVFSPRLVYSCVTLIPFNIVSCRAGQ